MSAPDTNTEKKDPAHKTPIVGMIAVVVFALVLLFGLVAWLSYAGNAPDSKGGVENGISTEVQPTDDAQQPQVQDGDNQQEGDSQ